MLIDCDKVQRRWKEYIEELCDKDKPQRNLNRKSLEHKNSTKVSEYMKTFPWTPAVYSAKETAE